MDKEGNIFGEFNDLNGVKIDWWVDVVNKKVVWYNFDIVLDMFIVKGEYDMDGNVMLGGLLVLS